MGEFNIGEGVLAAMEENSDEPRSDEVYENSAGQPTLSRTYGRDAMYIFIGRDNKVHRIPFDV